MNDSKKNLEGFAIVEQRGKKTRWIRLGPAFENEADESITLYCNALPTDLFATGELKINIRSARTKNGD